jgi:hypothetical protein
VIEGVLCDPQPITHKRRLRTEKVTGYHINWHEVPIKRATFMKEHWPDNGMDLVTFISEEFLDDALHFLIEARFPYDSAAYTPFNKFTSVLRFQTDLLAIYDSDPGRLDQYGQKGFQVQRGMDF